MADDTTGDDDTSPLDDTYAIGTPDRILAGFLLAGSIMLAYICMDVLAGGALTNALRRKGREE